MSLACVTLSRNQGAFLQEAINSVIKQNHLNEYVIYDVGSTDASRDIIENYSESVKIILVDNDGGPSDGLNTSFDLTKSTILYYLNGDDRAIDGAFKYAEKYFQDNASCDVLHGSIRIINRQGEVTGIKPSMKFSLRGYALGYSVVYQQATFFRRAIFDKTKFNLENKTCWDGELIVDMALAGARIHQTKKILGEFRIYSDSITGSGRLREQIKKDHARIAKKILGRELRKTEIIFGIMIGKFKAIQRRVLKLGPGSNLN